LSSPLRCGRTISALFSTGIIFGFTPDVSRLAILCSNLRCDAETFLYCGFGVAFFFIIIVSSALGGVAFALRCICRRISSGLGIPGVGVAPGLNGLFRFAGSGIPGVGVVPFGILFATFGSGIPGVVFVDGCIGLVERPSGKLLASTVTLPLPAFGFELAFELTVDPSDEHEAASIDMDKRKRPTRFFDINKI
jgi:hypothetical protein